jgi:hypothetical protein
MTLLEQLHQLAPLAAAATEGPWTAWVGNGQVFEGLADINTNGRYHAAQDGSTDGRQICQCDPDYSEDDDEEADTVEANAAFIAATRNLLTPANLQRLIALEAAALAAPVAAAPARQALCEALTYAMPTLAEDKVHAAACLMVLHLRLASIRAATTMEGGQPNA